VERREVAPCAGDSGTGAEVIRRYRRTGDQSEVFGYYEAELPPLGWNATGPVVVDHSGGGDFKAQTFEKSFDGWTGTIELRGIHRADQDFDVLLYGDNPPDACDVARP
jgi:hypothetical protein